jgi:hypothetical protein
MAVQLLGIFLFEEFFRASVIVILAVWLVATPAATRLGARMRRPMPWRPPPFAPRAAPREAS